MIIRGGYLLGSVAPKQSLTHLSKAVQDKDVLDIYVLDLVEVYLSLAIDEDHSSVTNIVTIATDLVRLQEF